MSGVDGIGYSAAMGYVATIGYIGDMGYIGTTQVGHSECIGRWEGRVGWMSIPRNNGCWGGLPEARRLAKEQKIKEAQEHAARSRACEI